MKTELTDGDLGWCYCGHCLGSGRYPGGFPCRHCDTEGVVCHRTPPDGVRAVRVLAIAPRGASSRVRQAALSRVAEIAALLPNEDRRPTFV